ncbi:MAG: DUF2891 domain-containing protein [Bryobacteraceae bacterium]
MNLILDSTLAARLARLALDCVHREYPNKIAHVLNGDADVRPPRELTPAFYGCFDWHSAVHAHWLLARVARLFPKEGFTAEARAALARSITRENIAAEFRYSQSAGRLGFERPYGLAWLLALGAELRLSDFRLAATLLPLEITAARRLQEWLEKLPRPDRSGQHFNTAFALGLALDASRISGHPKLAEVIQRRARDYYLADRDAPVPYEPSGEDFLSPSLAEADLMRRVLPSEEFDAWLAAFLPDPLPLEPVVSADPSDGKLVHADGLNLSRAWMIAGIAGRRPALAALAESHAIAGLAAVTGEYYEGGHWLGTFALYLLTADTSRAP